MSMVPAPQGTPALNMGQTALDATDFVPPRVKILQPMSKETTGDARAGDWFNTLTSENYGPALKVTPITPLKQRVFLVRKERVAGVNMLLASAGLEDFAEDTDGLQCRSLDMFRGIGHPGDELWLDSGKGCNECPLSKWTGNKPPPCTETYNVACVTDEGDLAIIGMSKSGAKTGKKWFSMLRLRPGAPWGRQYELTTTEQTNDLGRFWVPQVRLLPEVTPSDLMATAAYWSRELTGKVIDVTPMDDEGEDSGPIHDDAQDLASAKF